MSQERTGLFSRLFGKSDPGTAGRGPIETVSLWRAFETIQTQVRSVHEGSGSLVPKLVRQASLSEGAIDRVRAGRDADGSAADAAAGESSGAGGPRRGRGDGLARRLSE